MQIDKLIQQLTNSNDEMEFMPIIPLGESDVDNLDPNTLPETLPIIALRNTVLFPNVVLPITVAREKSLEAIKIIGKEKWIGVVAQKDTNDENPTAEGLHHIGTLAKVVKQIKLPDGNSTIFIMGRVRFEIEEIIKSDPAFEAKVTYLTDDYPQNDAEFEAIVSSIKDNAERILQQTQNIPPEAVVMLKNLEQYPFLLNFISSNLSVKIAEKQRLLEEHNVKTRSELLLNMLQTELQLVELKNEIAHKTRTDIDKQQREYFLQQQLKSIKDELGGDPNEKETKDLIRRAEEANLPPAVLELFQKNIEKLERMHSSTPDYSVIYNHLDLILDLPWGTVTTDNYDLKDAKKILDTDHFGMDKIKDRILEYLAVLKLKGDLKSPILCFVGPPGIGKTSLGKSIANALGRKYVRLSLGGLHDESELRGHRKTYIGAMPGRIIQNIRKVKSSNPVFVLDEIEKMGKDFRGDPSSALLEILDPEQNTNFYDNYLELEYDLSKVLFIATANSISEIQPALRDRMEIIHLSGYSTEEKVQIVKKHLIHKQKELHGLEKLSIKITDKVITQIITDYTRESGVRELDRVFASIMRKIAKAVAMEEWEGKPVTVEMVREFLGKPKFSFDEVKKALVPGVAVGLAWTYVGGDILFIEASKSKGKGALQLTGNLGNVMKESASAAWSYIKANANSLGVNEDELSKIDIHIHVPEGAVPKDGPSAGITMLTAMLSSLLGKKVKSLLAMTGEITLRGQVLPVGGIKEKVLAAKRSGIKDIILCEANRKDIEEISEEYLKGLKFHYVNQMSDVVTIAFGK